MCSESREFPSSRTDDVTKRYFSRDTLRKSAECYLRIARGAEPLLLDAPAKVAPRYGYGKPAHPLLYQLIDQNRKAYRATLESFLTSEKALAGIPVRRVANAGGPYWDNGWFEGIDAAALFCLLGSIRPRRYLEVGSGFSTAFAARAKADFHLRTEITSIDPSPRIMIDEVCDRVIRKRLEEMDLSIFEELEEGDFLLVDSSHFCYMNSDVATFFFDVLPRLEQGIMVHFHDIFLPYDYPPEMADRYYSEQYLLGTYLLATAGRIDIVLPNSFVMRDLELSSIARALLMRATPTKATMIGGSFWIRTGAV